MSQTTVEPRTLAPRGPDQAAHRLSDIIVSNSISIVSLLAKVISSSYLHAVIVGLRQQLRLALPSARPRAQNLHLAHHLAYAARARRATHCTAKILFRERARNFHRRAKHHTWPRGLPPLPPSSPLAQKASKGSREEEEEAGRTALHSSSSSSGSEAGKSELEETTLLHTAHSHVSTTTTPPSMTGHTQALPTLEALQVILLALSFSPLSYHW